MQPTIFSKPNSNRGLPMHAVAEAFRAAFPIGKTLTAKQFDQFAIEVGGVAPPASIEKGSDGWLAFMQRRHQFKYALNKAGTHPRMIEHGMEPFFLDQSGAGIFEVKAPAVVAVTHGHITKRIESLVKTKRNQLRYLMESVDYDKLPPAEQTTVMLLSQNIVEFEERISDQIKYIDRRFDQLRSSVKLLVDQGKITPENGGIKALTDGIEPPDEEGSFDDILAGVFPNLKP